MLGDGHIATPFFPLSSTFTNGNAILALGDGVLPFGVAHLEFIGESKLRVPT